MTDVPAEQHEPRRIDPARYDAIHRALLTGLLGNVGVKGDGHEYTGARGRKFHLFPGSNLFSRKPPWVMAGELVETTRLYARTVARVQPQWIERAAEHLAQRAYNEPHWSRETAHVVAYERVTLFGLVLVPRRRVHYGPIQPKISRELFIHGALVDEQYNTDAQYFRHNRDLVREIELLEAKFRRRDVLVDAKTRFAFYDARIPAGIHNGPLFEKWRRQAEEKNKRVLFMSREDLVVPAAQLPPTDLFPDELQIDKLRVPLTYRYEVGHPADGVTAVLPLLALNQLPVEPFDWLVPGWLEEKVIALIKTLPKELRVHFVPAPDVARSVMPALRSRYREGTLTGALAWELGRLTGIQVPPDAWQADAVPESLRMNFQVLDESGKPIAAGRDLNEIRRALRIEVKQTFASLPQSPFNRDNVTRWDFEDLPERVEVRRPGITLRGFPALVDNGASVSLRLLESPEAANQSMRLGLRRLFMLQLSDEMKYLAKNLPGIQPMCLHYAPISSCQELRQDLLAVIVERALFDNDEPIIRTKEQFAARAEVGWRRLSATAQEVAALVGQILAAHQALTRQLSGPVAPLLEPAVRDMTQQLGHMVYRGFVARTPWTWLQQIPRYLKGIETRLRKLTNAGYARDAQAASEIMPLWQQYLRRLQFHRDQGIKDPAMEQYRWMMEELRVSLFAQELKTSIPVSVKRLETQWAQVRT